MRTCYCNGVTSDPTGSAAVARPSANVGPSVWPGARPWAGLGAGPETSAGPRASAGPGAGAGSGLSAGPGRSWAGAGPSRCNVSHVWRIKNVTLVTSRAPAQRQRPHLGPRLNVNGRISGPGATAAAAPRAPAQRRRPHLYSKRKRPRRTSRRGRTNRPVLQSAAIEDYSSL